MTARRLAQECSLVLRNEQVLPPVISESRASNAAEYGQILANLLCTYVMQQLLFPLNSREATLTGFEPVLPP